MGRGEGPMEPRTHTLSSSRSARCALHHPPFGCVPSFDIANRSFMCIHATTSVSVKMSMYN